MRRERRSAFRMKRSFMSFRARRAWESHISSRHCRDCHDSVCTSALLRCPESRRCGVSLSDRCADKHSLFRPPGALVCVARNDIFNVGHGFFRAANVFSPHPSASPPPAPSQTQVALLACSTSQFSRLLTSAPRFIVRRTRFGASPPFPERAKGTRLSIPGKTETCADSFRHIVTSFLCATSPKGGDHDERRIVP